MKYIKKQLSPRRNPDLKYIGKHLNTQKIRGDSLRGDSFVEIAFSGVSGAYGAVGQFAKIIGKVLAL